MILLDGKYQSAILRDILSKEIQKVYPKRPCLLSIMVGESSEALSYIKNKEKSCAEVGIHSQHISLSADCTESSLLETISEANLNPEINGIILQMPLPKNINQDRIVSSIDPNKDVDGLHPLNLGKLLCGNPLFAPATPLAVIHLLESYGIPLSGKKAVIIGRSNIVGKPLSLLLLQHNCTVTIAHSKTSYLPNETLLADILLVAIGQAKLIDQGFIKPGAVVVDIGINFIQGKLVGDVDFNSVAPLCSYISPVPGGVGSLTTTMLLQNTWKAFKLQQCP
jgi:methylenetetrahydrofolate dehydrogenase (NADP+) / methenyltetrahydrofolate cyclohydrolase